MADIYSMFIEQSKCQFSSESDKTVQVVPESISAKVTGKKYFPVSFANVKRLYSSG